LRHEKRRKKGFKEKIWTGREIQDKGKALLHVQHLTREKPKGKKTDSKEKLYKGQRGNAKCLSIAT